MNRTSRTAAAFAASVVALLTLISGVVVGAPPAGAEPTGGCRAVGGGAVQPGGSHRATVVVDPGSGPVWSACVEFTGTISGVQALELAAATIPGLTPVYEPYPGQGRAICRLLGVGNDPPDCMSKSVEYWAYFRNDVYSRGGASGSVVADGDVEGWVFGRGQPPRAATVGTEAVLRSALPPATTLPAPPPPPGPEVTDPAPGGASPDPDPGGRPPATAPGADGGATGAPDEPAGPSSTVAGSTVPVVGDGTAGTVAPAGGDGGGRESARATSDEAADGGAAAPPIAATGTSADDDGSGATSALGFGAALGVAAVAAVGVRARRRHLSA